MLLKDFNHEMQKQIRKQMKIPQESKYKNTRCERDGEKFDSQKEMNRYYELKLLERAGEIKNLNRQVRFKLVDGTSYIADFTYDENGKFIVEDTKGMKTPVYKIKKNLMKELLGILIRES